MKILFVLTEIGSRVPSHHSISILSAVAKRAGHKTALLEMERMDPRLLDEAIASVRPDVVGFTAVTQQLPYVRKLIDHCKARYPNIRTMLGGTHAILRPRVIDEIPGLDVLAQNESEGPFVEYLAALEAGEDPSDIPNFAIRHGGDVVSPRRTYTCDEAEMTALPFEDRELFPKWRDTPKGVPLESLGIRPRFWFQRGCPYSCTYCAVPAMRKAFPSKGYTRYPSVERAIAEIQHVADRWTFKRFVIDDDVLTQRKEWVVELANKYPPALLDKSYEVCMRIETAHDETLRALKATNCGLLKFGMESGDYELRKHVLKRNITDERTIEVFQRCKQLGLKTHTFCIIGFPEETRRQVWTTVRLNQKLKPTRTQISIFYPYPGTELGDAVVNAGMVVDGWETVENYFDESALKLKYLTRWEVKVYARLFRLAVYARYSPRLAWQEIIGLAKKIRDRLMPKRKGRYDLESTSLETREAP